MRTWFFDTPLEISPIEVAISADHLHHGHAYCDVEVVGHAADLKQTGALWIGTDTGTIYCNFGTKEDPDWRSVSGGSSGIDFVQRADPGAVGAAKTWLQLPPEGVTFERYQLFVRNAVNDDWLTIGIGDQAQTEDSSSQPLAVYCADAGPNLGNLLSALQLDSDSASIRAKALDGLATGALTVQVLVDQKPFVRFDAGGDPGEFRFGGSLLYEGTADPTATPPGEWSGGGSALYLRNNSGVTEMWIATGPDPTDWTRITP